MSRALPFVLLFSVLTLGGCSSLSSLNRDTTAVTGLDSKEAKEALRLARVLRDNSRLPGSYEIYEGMDQRQQLKCVYLIEYASVAAQVRPPRETFALYNRARQELGGNLQAMPGDQRVAHVADVRDQPERRRAIGARHDQRRAIEVRIALLPSPHGRHRHQVREVQR